MGESDKQPKPIQQALQEFEDAFFGELIDASLEGREPDFDTSDPERARGTHKMDLEGDIADIVDRRNKLAEEFMQTQDPATAELGGFLTRELLEAEDEQERLRKEDLPPEED